MWERDIYLKERDLEMDTIKATWFCSSSQQPFKMLLITSTSMAIGMQMTLCRRRRDIVFHGSCALLKYKKTTCFAS